METRPLSPGGPRFSGLCDHPPRLSEPQSCETRGWQDHMVRQENLWELDVAWCPEANGVGALWNGELRWDDG